MHPYMHGTAYTSIVTTVVGASSSSYHGHCYVFLFLFLLLLFLLLLVLWFLVVVWLPSCLLSMLSSA